jgi:hypothetical protein
MVVNMIATICFCREPAQHPGDDVDDNVAVFLQLWSWLKSSQLSHSNKVLQPPTTRAAHAAADRQRRNSEHKCTTDDGRAREPSAQRVRARRELRSEPLAAA